MKRLRKHEATGASGGNGGKNLTANFGIRLYFTTNEPPMQQVSSLLDLAQHEADQAKEAYLSAEALADARRRKYFRAMDNLRSLQREIFPPGGPTQ